MDEADMSRNKRTREEDPLTNTTSWYLNSINTHNNPIYQEAINGSEESIEDCDLTEWSSSTIMLGKTPQKHLIV